MEPKPIYGSVSLPRWDSAWIMAGGPSAQRFDLDRLRDKHVICVNDAIFLFHGAYPTCAPTLFSIDCTWIQRWRGFLESYPGEKYAAFPLETFPDAGGVPGVTYLQSSTEDGLSNDPGVIYGHESGRGAINLAWLKGTQEIHLIGYDMDPMDDEKWLQWLPRYKSLVPQILERGVNVWNHNPSSSIDVFDKECA